MEKAIPKNRLIWIKVSASAIRSWEGNRRLRGQFFSDLKQNGVGMAYANSFFMQTDEWIKTDLSPNAVMGKPVSVFASGGNVLSGILEVEAALQGKMLVRVNYSEVDSSGVSKMKSFRLNQQKFNSVLRDGPGCILDVPK